jgi:flagellar biosynthesis protein FlhG
MNRLATNTSDAPAAQSGPILWAVGGGKGGVGKSVVSSSLAIAFARRGLRCALVDLDLGAANLHSLLGVAFPRSGTR